MKAFTIKLIKGDSVFKNTFGLYRGETLITWSCSAASLFKFLKSFQLRDVLLQRKRALIKGFTFCVEKIDNMLNGLGRQLRDVPPVGDLRVLNSYEMKTIINHYSFK